MSDLFTASGVKAPMGYRAQLPLPIVMDCDPRVQLAAARKLQRMVDERRKSFACQDYRKRRRAALKVRTP